MYSLPSTTNLGQHKGHRGTRHRLPARRHHDKRATTRSDGDQHHSDGPTPRHSTWTSCSNSHPRTEVKGAGPWDAVEPVQAHRRPNRVCMVATPVAVATAAATVATQPQERSRSRPPCCRSHVTRGGRRTGSTAIARSRCQRSRCPRSSRGGAREAGQDEHRGSTAAVLTCKHRTGESDQIRPGILHV